MKRGTNRERILSASIELFNLSGVVAVTTNHIASHLGISPGNLYFHFGNKEEIIRELFDRMCHDVYAIWLGSDQLDSKSTPTSLVERSYEVFWSYRFFHREMYHLRRKDPILARKWKQHLVKTVRLLTATYSVWVKNDVMKQIKESGEMRMISDVVLITSSSFLQFYESPARPASRRSLRQGIEHILRFLMPYHTEKSRGAVETKLATYA